MRSQLQEQHKDLGFQQALRSACRMLAIREHSKKQIRQKLMLKGFTEPVIGQCIDYLIEENWLCETRFCQLYLRSKTSKGQGQFRIVQALRNQDIAPDLINQALAAGAIDWQHLCDQTLAKKLNAGHYALITNDPHQAARSLCQAITIKERIRLQAFLGCRGFTDQQIKQSIKAYLSQTRSFKP